jgi:photosystem II stability/assembly factor-like uncharacterized protein
MDPLEDRLRDALRDDAWRLSPDPDALERIRAGAAARRRRHRTAATSVVAALVVLVGLGGVSYVMRDLAPSSQTTAAGGASQATTMEASRGQAPHPDAATQPPTQRQDQAEPSPQRGTGAEGPQQSQTKEATPNDGVDPVPPGFSPVSITAASEQNFWVLGQAAGAPDTATVAVTRDGGSSFSALPPFGAKVVRDDNRRTGEEDNQLTEKTVREVRFSADARNGWAYGGALWTTHEGGRAWKPIRSVPGLVERVEASAGAAYALVRHDGSWTLWRSPVDEDAWKPLNVVLNQPASLAVTRDLVAVTDRVQGKAYVVVSADAGATFTQRTTPCEPDLEAGSLSASAKALWLTCPTGTAASVNVSEDAGATWSQVPSGIPAISATASSLGARSPRRAVVAVPGRALILGKDGDAKSTADDAAPVKGLGTPTYAGFTSDRVGYILDVDGGLFRTTDGGGTWSSVSVR